MLVLLTQILAGKLFGDKGYLGKKLAAALLKRGLALMTRVNKNMKALPLSMTDKLLLNARKAETIIGHIKAFSSLKSSQHKNPLLGLYYGVLNVAASEIVLNELRIASLLGKGEDSDMAEQARMSREEAAAVSL